MADEISAYLDKAQRSLVNARAILSVGANEDAGRAAYIAALSAALALIFAKTGTIAKTHNGVNAQFYALIKEDARIDHELQRFLTRAYRLKEVADYEVGTNSVLPASYAQEAIEGATKFVNAIRTILDDK